MWRLFTPLRSFFTIRQNTKNKTKQNKKQEKKPEQMNLKRDPVDKTRFALLEAEWGKEKNTVEQHVKEVWLEITACTQDLSRLIEFEFSKIFSQYIIICLTKPDTDTIFQQKRVLVWRGTAPSGGPTVMCMRMRGSSTSGPEASVQRDKGAERKLI